MAEFIPLQSTNYNLAAYYHKLIFYFILILFNHCISFAPKKSEMNSAQGKIIKSDVEKKHKFRSSYVGHNDFYAEIEYEYEVDGKKFSSRKINFWNATYNSRSKAEKAITPYPLGKEVTVFYKKENPQEAYLEVEDDTKEEED